MLETLHSKVMVTVTRGSSNPNSYIGHWLKLMVSFTPWPFTPGHPYNRLVGPWGWSRSSRVERFLSMRSSAVKHNKFYYSNIDFRATCFDFH
jgi:hypothetical protein